MSVSALQATPGVGAVFTQGGGSARFCGADVGAALAIPRLDGGSAPFYGADSWLSCWGPSTTRPSYKCTSRPACRA